MAEENSKNSKNQSQNDEKKNSEEKHLAEEKPKNQSMTGDEFQFLKKVHFLANKNSENKKSQNKQTKKIMVQMSMSISSRLEKLTVIL